MDPAKKIFATAVAGALRLGLGLEDRPAPARVPPGATLVSFWDLGGGGPLVDPARARPGDYLKAVPDRILKLDGRRVMIQGFMIPTQVQARAVREFMLVRSQANCCFGVPLQVADVVGVRMAGSPAEPLMDRVVSVVGRLHVQEHWTGPYLGALYQLDAESATADGPARPLNLPRLPQAKGRE